MIDLAIWLMGSPTPVAVTGSTYCKFADNDVSDSVNSDFGDKVEDGTFDVEDLEYGKCLDVIPTNYATDREHARNLRHFYDVVIEGAEPCFKPQQGIDMIKILCAVYESARTGREVVL